MASSSNYGHVKIQDISRDLSTSNIITVNLGSGCENGSYNLTCSCSLVCIKATFTNTNNYARSIHVNNCTPFPFIVLSTSKGLSGQGGNTLISPGQYYPLGQLKGNTTETICGLLAVFKAIPYI